MAIDLIIIVIYLLIIFWGWLGRLVQSENQGLLCCSRPSVRARIVYQYHGGDGNWWCIHGWDYRTVVSLRHLRIMAISQYRYRFNWTKPVNGFSINPSKLHTVTQVLKLRYSPSVKWVGSIVMMVYDFMVAVTYVTAIGSILSVLFNIPMISAIWSGSTVVVLYTVLRGMWSLTRTDILQFILKTIWLLFILMPASIIHARWATYCRSFAIKLF